jgi:DNA-binding transcriptional regulator YhcF (GntR family)
MKKVTAYESEDGSMVSRDKSAVEKYDKDAAFKAAVEEIVESNGYNGMRKEEIVEMIIDNADILREALRGGRK